MSKNTSISTQRIEDVFSVLEHYVQGNFHPKVRISKKADELDAIAAMINYLGEALSAKVVSLSRLQSTKDSLPNISISVDLQNRICEVNKRGVEQLGFSSFDLVGKDFSNLLPEFERDYFQEVYKILFNEDRIYNFETYINTGLGTPLPVFCSAGLLRDYEERVTGIIFQIQDITALKEAEGKLKRANQDLESFNHKLIHDIRGPINSLEGLVDLYQRDDSPDQAKAYMRLMKDSLRSLLFTIQSLAEETQTFTQPEEQRALNFDHMVEMAKKMLEPRIAVAGDTFEVQLINNCEYDVHSDQSAVFSIFRNLIDNAYKYRRPGTPARLTIQVDDSQDPQGVCISFRDNGQGIPEEIQAHIFEKGVRGVQPSSDIPGSGQGLYFVANNLSRIKGSIKVNSRPEAGTTFFVYVPDWATVPARS